MTAGARVDIGIPTRATGSPERLDFLRQAVESVLAQTFADFRLTVSENAAVPDAALAATVAPFLADPRVRHVTTGADLSAARNSNLVFERAEAPYVAILHDDDLWDPGFLERRVDFLDRHPDCAYVFGGNRLIDERGTEFGRSTPALAPGLHRADEYLPKLLRREGMPMPPTALLRREPFLEAGGFDERFPAWDYDLYLRLLARWPAGYLDVWDSAFRVHSRQQTYRERWGELKIVHEDVIDEILRRDVPHLRLPPAERRRRRAGAFLSAALDAVETGQRRRAVELAASALRIDPRALANPRLPAVLLVLVLGVRGRGALTRARTAVRRRAYLGRRRPEGAER